MDLEDEYRQFAKKWFLRGYLNEAEYFLNLAEEMREKRISEENDNTF